MKKLYRNIGMAAIALLTAGMLTACAEEAKGRTAADGPVPELGKAAPAFRVTDTYGKTHSLDQYRGKWVVLEWLNHECPYVRKHYGGGAMQALQKKYAGKVVWLSIVSSAPGKQGHHSNEEANELTKEKGAAPSAVLIDETGTVGRAYDARTTPHMFVIDPQGRIVYMGGIDDKNSTRKSDLQTARPHVDIALQEALAGKPISVPTSQPYGCDVKY
ncbi:MAG TPA: thioredoxin family protein [Thermoanaerobaculia bacterium]